MDQFIRVNLDKFTFICHYNRVEYKSQFIRIGLLPSALMIASQLSIYSAAAENQRPA